MTHDPKPSYDERLRKAILTRLAADQRTAFVNIRVGVLNGIVHLAGVVPSIEMRVAAAELVGDVPGIRGVVNRIEAPGAPSPGRTINLDFSSSDEHHNTETDFQA